MRFLALGLLCVSSLFSQKITTLVEGLNQPFGLGIGPDGALYFTEVGNHRISRFDMKAKKLTVVADGLQEPYEIAFNKAGDLFFCDRLGHVVQKIDRKTKAVTPIAGTGKAGYSGDGGPATAAQFNQPHSIVFAPDGKLLICDILNFRIRRMDLGTGVVDTWAGIGQTGKAGDEAPISGTPLAGPRAIAVDKAGNYYLALREGNAIYKMDVKSGRMTRFAGTGEKGFTGDGGPAKTATLSGPKGVALAPDGSLYIADTENHAIRKVDGEGTITTVADKLKRPHGVFVDTRGALYIGDSENNRILLVK